MNLVDARTFDDVESIRVSPVDVDVNIAGLAFAPDSKSIMVASENGTLEYRIDMRARHSFPAGSIM